ETAPPPTPPLPRQRAVAPPWRAPAGFLDRPDPNPSSRRNAPALGPKQIQTLTTELARIIHREIFDAVLSDRIVNQVKTAIDYAMHSAWDTRRTQSRVCRAMQFLAKTDRSNRILDPLDNPEPHLASILARPHPLPAVAPPPGGQPAKLSAPPARPAEAAPAAPRPLPTSSDAITAKLCNSLADESAKQSTEQGAAAPQNGAILQ